MHIQFLAVLASALLTSVGAIRASPKLVPPIAPIKISATSTIVESSFKQLIDHARPELGTFSQRYWYNAQWWSGEGAPVVLFTPGEVAAEYYTGYLTNRTLTGLFAQELGGAAVLLEHRYWGTSTPYANLTTEALQYLTLKNAITDLTYFADTVVLPFDPKGTSRASMAPWVLSGGSYSGALAAWTARTAPGTFWAYTATSAPVQAISNYWEYFVPIQQGMPSNCSKDVTLVIDYIDSVMETGTTEEKAILKQLFMMEGVKHDADFTYALADGPYLWQENQFFYNYGFFTFCDYVENAETAGSTVPGAKGVGLKKALAGYAKWWVDVYLPGSCESYGYSDFNGTYNVECFSTFNASSPFYTDWSVNNAYDRQWWWFLCNEPFAYWQTGAPKSDSTICSRLDTVAYQQRQCGLFFPTVDGYTYGSAEGATVADVNRFTDGWDISGTERLLLVNGEYDPWREASTSSDFRPGGPLKSTKALPQLIVPGGYHCSDLLTYNGVVNAGVQKVIEEEVAQIVKWVGEYSAVKAGVGSA